MNINDNVLSNIEKILFSLRDLYMSSGYTPYRMSKFEEYDLYARNKDFLVSDNVITFTDTTGKLMALKPDVTLSIIKNSKDDPQSLNKVFYNENVYRVSKGTNSFNEIMQTGLECFGSVDNACVYQVIDIAARSLAEITPNFVLSISDLDILEDIVNSTGASAESKEKLYSAVSEKNNDEISRLCSEYDLDTESTELLKKLVSVRCSVCEAEEVLVSLIGGVKEKYADFLEILASLSKGTAGENIIVDFSAVSDINYYNGIIFKGFVSMVPNAVLSGGCYDRLMRKLHRKSKAIGFAIYLDELERIDFSSGDAAESKSDTMLNIALPKGRLGEKVYSLMAGAGFECPSILEPNRKLIFENREKGVRYFWVKPSDVAIYVERGAADVGVAGKDILLEYEPDVYELLNLNTGKCRMAVAAPVDFTDDPSKTLKVATKFSNIASGYYRSLGRDIDIIHLNGSIEIAPILGLSDVIVDIVETGKTLAENNLKVFEEIVPISARLIANKTSYKFKAGQIEKLRKGLSQVTED